MHYNVSEMDSFTRYEYTFEDNTSCVFSVSKVGIISIDVRQRIEFEYLCNALEEVSNITSEKGLTPKMDIKNSNKFFQALATHTGFTKLPSRGISFSVWVKH